MSNIFQRCVVEAHVIKHTIKYYLQQSIELTSYYCYFVVIIIVNYIYVQCYIYAMSGNS